MTLPVSEVTIENLWDGFIDSAINLQSYAQQMQAGLGAGSLPAYSVINTLNACITFKNVIDNIVEQNQNTIDAFLTYGATQVGNANIDIVTEATISFDASQNLAANIVNDYPTNSGYIEYATINTSNGFQVVTFTSGFANSNIAITNFLSTLS